MGRSLFDDVDRHLSGFRDRVRERRTAAGPVDPPSPEKVRKFAFDQFNGERLELYKSRGVETAKDIDGVPYPKGQVALGPDYRADRKQLGFVDAQIAALPPLETPEESAAKERAGKIKSHLDATKKLRAEFLSNQAKGLEFLENEEDGTVTPYGGIADEISLLEKQAKKKVGLIKGAFTDLEAGQRTPEAIEAERKLNELRPKFDAILQKEARLREQESHFAKLYQKAEADQARLLLSRESITPDGVARAAEQLNAERGQRMERPAQIDDQEMQELGAVAQRVNDSEPAPPNAPSRGRPMDPEKFEQAVEDKSSGELAQSTIRVRELQKLKESGVTQVGDAPIDALIEQHGGEGAVSDARLQATVNGLQKELASLDHTVAQQRKQNVGDELKARIQDRRDLTAKLLQEKLAERDRRGLGLSEQEKADRQGIGETAWRRVASMGARINSAIAGVLSTGADVVGADTVRDRLNEFVQASLEVSEEAAPAVRSLDDIQDLDTGIKYAVGAAAEQIPTLGFLKLFGLIGKMAAPASTLTQSSLVTHLAKEGFLKGKKAKQLLGVLGKKSADQVAGVAAGSVTLQSGLIQNDLLQHARQKWEEDTARYQQQGGEQPPPLEDYVDQYVAPLPIMAMGLATGALDGFSGANVLRRLGLMPKARKGMFEILEKDRIFERILKTQMGMMTTEIPTELAQELGERLALKWADNEVKYFGPELAESLKETYVQVFAGMGILGGVTGGFQRPAPQEDGTTPPTGEQPAADILNIPPEERQAAIDAGIEETVQKIEEASVANLPVKTFEFTGQDGSTITAEAKTIAQAQRQLPEGFAVAEGGIREVETAPEVIFPDQPSTTEVPDADAQPRQKVQGQGPEGEIAPEVEPAAEEIPPPLSEATPLEMAQRIVAGESESEILRNVSPEIAERVRAGVTAALAETEPDLPRPKNTPRAVFDTLSTRFKPTKKGKKALQDYVKLMKRFNPEAFEGMRIEIVDGMPEGVRDSPAVYSPERNALVIDAKAPENQGDGIIRTLVHESFHFAEKFAGVEDVVKSEWSKLDDKQRADSWFEYAKERVDGATLRDNPTARSEWFAFQGARVLRGDTEGMSRPFVEKIQEFLNAIREVVKDWTGDKSLTTPELDAQILDMLGYERAKAETAEPAPVAPGVTGVTPKVTASESIQRHNLPQDLAGAKPRYNFGQ